MFYILLILSQIVVLYGKVLINFLGKHPGDFVADVEWGDNNEGPIVNGTARLKMLKWLVYPVQETSRASRDADGAIHVSADLASQFGNGALKCTLDVAPDRSVTGEIPLLKGVKLTFTGSMR